VILSFKIYNFKCKVYHRVFRVSSAENWVWSTKLAQTFQSVVNEKEIKNKLKLINTKEKA